MKDGLWQDWMVLAGAGWLMIAPFGLGFASISQPSAIVAWIAAAALYVSGSEALVGPDVLEEWMHAGIGAGLVVSPWALGYAGERLPTWNAVITGSVIAACGLLGILHNLHSAHQRAR